MRSSEAEIKDLVPGLYLYHFIYLDKVNFWVALIGNNKTYTARVASGITDIKEAYKKGKDISESETFKYFPILKTAGFIPAQKDNKSD